MVEQAALNRQIKVRFLVDAHELEPDHARDIISLSQKHTAETAVEPREIGY